ncbi:MAG: ThiF family adenylyltransferase [Pseudobdellovibrio sp.]
MEYETRTKRNHYWVGGVAGQSKIKDMKIGIAGLGGMGSNIAEIFARLGVCFLRITDPDTIERTNINRQVIAYEDTIGVKKATASAQNIKRISKDIFLDVSTEGIQPHNVEAFVEGLDVVINEIDVYHVDKQILLIEAAHRRGIPVYTSLVVGLGIHLYKYCPNSNFKAKDFLGSMLIDKSAEKLVQQFGQPLPSYMKDARLAEFIQQIEKGDVPIFGASTYLGQSLLAIRVLNDFKLINSSDNIPQTPCLPEFIVLDPLTFEFKVAKLEH